jgi:TRAP-type C4-dicarboxylate transport system permease small subunit
MRLPRTVRKTITAILVLLVPLICLVVLVWGLSEITPDWAFKSSCVTHIDEQLCYKCKGYYR